MQIRFKSGLDLKIMIYKSEWKLALFSLYLTTFIMNAEKQKIFYSY